MAKIFCRYCGIEANNVTDLVKNSGSCSYNPQGESHVPYEGNSEKSQHTCKYCGKNARSIESLVKYSGSCNKNPQGKNHVPMM